MDNTIGGKTTLILKGSQSKALIAGKSNIVRAQRGEHYKVVKKNAAGEEQMQDDVIAKKMGDNLLLSYADGTQLTLENYYVQCKAGDCDLTLPSNDLAGFKVSADGAAGAALGDGSTLSYAHGSPSNLMAMAQGDAALGSALTGLQGNQVTYAPGSAAASSGVSGWMAALGGLGVVAAASSKTTDTAATAPVNNIVKGQVTAGPIVSGNGLLVEVFKADGTSSLGTTTLNADGTFSLNVGSYTGVVIVKVTNKNSAADYLDEATGKPIDLDTVLMAVAVANGGTLVVNVNPVTTIAALKAGLASDGTGSVSDATKVTNANAAVASAFGLDNILTTTPVTTVTSSGTANTNYNTDDGTSAAEKYGAVLAALSGVGKTNGTSKAISTVAAGIDTTGSLGTINTDTQSLLVAGAGTATENKNAAGNDSLKKTVASTVNGPSTTPSTVDSKVATALAAIQNAAKDNNTDSLSLQTFKDAGVTGVNSSNLGAISSALNSAAVTDTQVGSTALVQGVVDAYSAILAGTGGNNAKATAAQYGLVGVTGMGTASASLLDDVLVSKTKSDVDTVTVLQKLADAANAVISAAAGGTSLALGQLTSLGIKDVNASNLEAVRTAIAGSDDSGSGVDTLAELQALVTAVPPGVPVLALGTGVSGGATAKESVQASGVITVSGEIGASISVTFTDQSNHTVTKTLTGTGSNQSVTLTSNDLGLGSNQLSDGNITVSAVVKDTAGNSSSQSLTFKLDTVAPTITSGDSASATAIAIAENSGAGQLVYTAKATDSEDISAGVTFSIGGTDATLFSIDTSTGKVTLTANPDYETKSSYSFTVTATDDAGNASTQTVSLGVNNLDEVAPTITSGDSASATAIDENSDANQPVYTATATDSGDISAGVTFFLGGDDSALFSIDQVTGEVRFNAAPDYENPGDAGSDNVYDLDIIVSDGVHVEGKSITVTVNNLDEASPTITSEHAVTIDENAGTNQLVYTATADDSGDTSAGVTFSLAEADLALFSIDSSTGAVTFKPSADYETQSSYSFTVTATDAAGNHSSQSVTLGVNNLNDNTPKFGTGTVLQDVNGSRGVDSVSSLSVQANGKILIAGSSSDGAASIFSVIRLNTDGSLDTSFSADGKVLQAVGNSYDTGHSMTLQADGKILLAGTSGDHFGLLRLNTDGSLDNTFSEDGKLTHGVGKSDVGNSVAVNTGGEILMAGTSDGKFNVVKFTGSGEVDTGFQANFAAISAVYGNCNSVRFTPDGQHILLAGTSSENGKTTGITLVQLNLDGSPDTTFGTQGVMTQEMDGYRDSNSITFDTEGNILVAGTGGAGGAGGNQFSLVKFNKTGELNEDFNGNSENATFISGYNFIGTSVTVDSNGDILMAGTRINFPSSNYCVFKLNADGTRNENFGDHGLLVREISTDTTGGFISLQQDGQILVAGSSSSDFGVMRLNPDGSFDKTFGQALKFDYTTVNENTTDLIYTAKAGDLDGSLNALTYSLDGADKNLFTIDATTGEVRFKTAPDYENPSDAGRNNVYNINLVASDSANSSSMSLAVTVKNTSETLPLFASGGTATPTAIDENSGAGQVIYTARASASDAAYQGNGSSGKGITYSLDGADASLFSINASTGEVQLIANPDYESHPSYAFIVIATDGAGKESSQAVTLDVNNLDEVAPTPTITSGDAATIDENSGAGQLVYTATADDAGVTFFLGGTDASLFSIDRATGALRFNAAPDYENPSDSGSDNVYDLTIIASDGVNQSIKSIKVTVQDVAEEGVTFTSGNTADGIDENPAQNTRVYTAHASASDASTKGQSIVYSLSPDDAEIFSINASTGEVTVIGSVDYELQSSYSFTVTATDSANQESSQTVTLPVFDVHGPITMNTVAEDNGLNLKELLELKDLPNQALSIRGTCEDGATVNLKFFGADHRAIVSGTDWSYTLTEKELAALVDQQGQHPGGYIFSAVPTSANGISSDPQTVAIKVDTVAPTFTSAATVQIEGGHGGGTLAYTATTDDPRGKTENINFWTLEQSDDWELFEMAPSVPGLVNTKFSPDYASRSSYTFTVLATDEVGNQSRQTVHLTLSDPNEASTASSSALVTNGDTLVATQTLACPTKATDADIFSDLHYSLSDGDTQAFSTDANAGKLKSTGLRDVTNEGTAGYAEDLTSYGVIASTIENLPIWVQDPIELTSQAASGAYHAIL